MAAEACPGFELSLPPLHRTLLGGAGAFAFSFPSLLVLGEQREALGMAGGVLRKGSAQLPWCFHSHPSPAEHVEVLQELQRLQRRLQPFLQRYCEVLGAAATADYNNNVSLLTAFPPNTWKQQVEMQIALHCPQG